MAEHFDKLLLDHISNVRNDEAEAMLNEELARAFDHSDFHGTLLHHAARHNNAAIARRLIELGADVDRFAGRCPTPLRVALMSINQPEAVVQVLLGAGASIDIVDNYRYSALKMALDWFCVGSELFKLFTCKLRTETRTNEELAERLIRAGCDMCHAAKLQDVDLMECMLKRSIDVNSKGSMKKSALHVAAELTDVSLADWLLKKGIDVESLDEYGSSALLKSVCGKRKAMVKLLLEHGAYPDINASANSCTPLSVAFSPLSEEPNEIVECAELLLQHGASLQNCGNLPRMFEFALNYSCDKALKLLIACLAMLEMLGEPVGKSVINSVDDPHHTKLPALQEYFESCQQVLAVTVLKKWSLLDLLNKSDSKMRLLVRQETLLQEIEKVNSKYKLSDLYSYYYNTMMRRIEKTSRVMKLENETILVICKIFEANYNQFYDFARGVVEYLNERDLERLIQL